MKALREYFRAAMHKFLYPAEEAPPVERADAVLPSGKPSLASQASKTSQRLSSAERGKELNYFRRAESEARRRSGTERQSGAGPGEEGAGNGEEGELPTFTELVMEHFYR